MTMPMPPRRRTTGGRSSSSDPSKKGLAGLLNKAKSGTIGGGDTLSDIGSKISSIDKKAKSVKKSIRGKLGI
jgi:hypothetical protein